MTAVYWALWLLLSCLFALLILKRLAFLATWLSFGLATLNALVLLDVEERQESLVTEYTASFSVMCALLLIWQLFWMNLLLKDRLKTILNVFFWILLAVIGLRIS